MFEVADVVAITKIDTLPVFNFSFEKCHKNIKKHREFAKIFEISALRNEGIDPLLEELKHRINSRYSRIK